MSHSSLRYPIGVFSYAGPSSVDQRQVWIWQIAALPGQLRAATTHLKPEQWETPYRPEGWTVRQVVHHLADSHINAYCRFKLALTEDEPVIKPYDEVAWAQLPDVRDTAAEMSLALLEALHRRWSALLRAMTATAFARTRLHPDQPQALTLDELLAYYAWHGQHHLGHITIIAEPPRPTDRQA